MAKYISFVYLTLIPLIFLFGIFLGYNYLAIGGLIILGFPSLLASFLVISKKNIFKVNPKSLNFNKPHFLVFNLIFILFYILSLIAAMLERNYIYFLVISLIAGFLLFELIYCYPIKYFNFVYIIKLILISLNMSLSYTLTHLASIFTTDLFYHFNYAKAILYEGQIVPVMGAYQYFPIAHIFFTIAFLIINSLSSWTYYLISSLLFSISIFSVYLLASRIMNSQPKALLTAFIFIFIPPVMYDSFYVIPRTFAFIIFLNVMQMLFYQRRDSRINLLCIFLTIVTILAHHTTLALFSCILLLFFFIDVLIVRANKIRAFFILFLFSSFVGYLIFIGGPFFDAWMKILTSISEPVLVGSGAYGSKGSSLLYETIIKNVWYLILVFFCLIGSFAHIINNSTISAVSNKSTKSASVSPLAVGTYNNQESISRDETSKELFDTETISKNSNIIFLSLFLFLPLQIPIVSDLFSSILGYRIPVIVAPFIALGSAAGFFHCLSNWRIGKNHNFLKIAIFFILIVFSINSMLYVGIITESDKFPEALGKSERNYFINSELNSFDFFEKCSNKFFVLYTDYQTSRYLNAYLNVISSCSIDGPYPNLPKNNYFLLRDREFSSYGGLTFDKGKISGHGFIGSNMIIVGYEGNSYFKKLYLDENIIYSNNAVSLYFKEI